MAVASVARAGSLCLRKAILDQCRRIVGMTLHSLTNGSDIKGEIEPGSRGWLTTTLLFIGVVALLSAPHVAVTREDHCGLLITMHMMETGWTLFFTATALVGVLAGFKRWWLALALCGAAATGFAVNLLMQINQWYSYQEPPQSPDLMARVFGHVIDVGLPFAMLGGLCYVLAAVCLVRSGEARQISGIVSEND